MRTVDRFLVSAAFIAVSLLAAPELAQAQTFGIQGGINLGNLGVTSESPGAPSVSTSWLVAPALGGFVTFDFAGLPLQVEALYSVKGAAKVKTANVSASDFRLTYFEVPVSIPFYSFGRFELFVGASFALKVDAKIKSGPITTEADEYFNDSDIGLTGGVAYKRGNLVVSGRYTHGLFDVDPLGDTVKNQALVVMVGWKLR
jgi:hypothetical protein